jgi:D-3-phosphoglycerate dehydrogenase
VSVDELLPRRTSITLHANLTEETRGMIGEEQLRDDEAEALLVNCGRGALVDQAALARALQEGWIAGAASTRSLTSRLTPDDPILRAPNTIITPHNSSHDRRERRAGERRGL